MDDRTAVELLHFLPQSAKQLDREPTRNKPSGLRRHDQWDHLAAVASVNLEMPIQRKYSGIGPQFGHSDKASIRKGHGLI